MVERIDSEDVAQEPVDAGANKALAAELSGASETYEADTAVPEQLLVQYRRLNRQLIMLQTGIGWADANSGIPGMIRGVISEFQSRPEPRTTGEYAATIHSLRNSVTVLGGGLSHVAYRKIQTFLDHLTALETQLNQVQ